MNIVYKDHLSTLICGDSREVIKELAETGHKFSAVITDPVWPNAPEGMFRMDCSPSELFANVAKYFPQITDRVLIEIGCDSDPRFLKGIPDELPFLRIILMEYAFPSYKGRILNGYNPVYVFGTPPPSTKGKRLIPGLMRYTSTSSVPRQRLWHPCPRKPEHIKYQLSWFAGSGTVLDPFAGSGTVLFESRKMGIPSVSIELREDYCENIINEIEGVRYNPFTQSHKNEQTLFD